jgi:ADP-ribosylglycohydrolase
MVGMAAGDALGAGYEFRELAPPVPEMIGGGLGHWEPGEWTDDTQMAICIANAAATGTLDPVAVAGNFLGWFQSGPADVGIQTRAVLGAATSTAEVAAVAAAYFADHPNSAAGNGSLMRTAPVALAHLGDDAALAAKARVVSDLTHGDPLAGDACVLWCVAIDRAIREGRLDGIRDGLGLLPAERRGFWEARIAEAETEPPASFNPNGYVVPALQAAYAAAGQSPIPAEQPCRHLHDALCAAVRIGNDTDTVAAIAGGLLGARWGASAIPAKWKTIIHGEPGYKVSDLIRLAVLSAGAGQPDDAGWPAAASLDSYYSSRYGSHPVRVGLDEDPDVTLGNVAGLAGLTVPLPDVVVSLCRVGRQDVPAGVTRDDVWLMDQPAATENPNIDFVLTDLAAQICDWRDEGKTVFIHCVQAESRTPTVAAAYLARRLEISGAEALARVRAVLPQAHPNPGFVTALNRLWPEEGA